MAAHALIGLGVLALVSAAAVTPAAPGIIVRGGGDCPTAAEVGAALVGLVTPSPAPPVPDVVDLIAQGATVSVRLSSATGEVIGDKRLPPSLSCAERARTAAVIVAAWEARLRGVAGTMAPLPPLTAPPAPSPVPPPAPPPAIRATAAASPAVRRPLQLETSAAVLASVAAAGVAPAAIVEVTFLRRDSPFALGVGALAVGAHATAVAPGRAVWRRFGGVLELKSTSRWPAVELEMHAGLALTALAVAGQSLPATSNSALFDPGLLAGLRVGFPLRRLSPWLEATAASWPRSHALYVDGSAVSTELPPFEALLGVGLSFGRER